MYTQCPGCKTIFRITVRQLRLGRGEVLCQDCQIVFNALNALADTIKGAIHEGAPPSHPPMLGRKEAVASSKYEQELFADLAEDERPTSPREPAGRYGAWDEEPEAPRASLAGRIAWGLGTLLLLAVLIAQVAVFEGMSLVQNERLRPWLELACESLECPLPEFKAPSSIQIIDRGLRPAPDDIEGYEFSLVMANQSGLPQAFPDLKLVLAEINGNPVATRIFKPEEYLIQTQAGLMAVGKPYEIRLLLAKPGREIGGFTFELN